MDYYIFVNIFYIKDMNEQKVHQAEMTIMTWMKTQEEAVAVACLELVLVVALIFLVIYFNVHDIV